ncbi:hypothetical protein FEM48_Zijuj06G0036900 [Ziziphus jujuba var. spinosa]|uniref:non-specific serine/threonine protein kinase n=1 Tax=Ziziphus jujuba var. spinosa TaxID=714518 RepID=A0A978V6Y9_ZIZJJ|nr:hypothetical protein FEM48_Zijuj06G0036900 [Ziziphus jujuba var. spinosa]
MVAFMFIFFSFLVLALISSPLLSSSASDTLNGGHSLSVEKSHDDVLVSPNGTFSAGFQAVGDNVYCFAVWFKNHPGDPNISEVVWMANRDVPVNGKRSKLSLLKSGKLVLTDANRIVVWATDTFSYLSVSLHLNDLGNLVLTNSEHVVLWQSFDSPTDTLLPLQPLTRTTKLVSSRSQSNVSSGFYTFYFDNNNLLSLLFDNQNISSVYWPSPWLVSWEAGRSTYNSSRVAILNSFGNFSSSDDLTFLSTEYGSLMQRRLKVDYDGNVRLYSRKKAGDEWSVSWQAFSEPCQIHGICGPNGLCSYVPGSGKRKCSCLPGYEIVNHTDWSFGCQPTFKFESCSRSDSKFHRVSSTDFYGYDYGFFPNKTYNECVDLCLKLCNCKGFQYKFSFDKGYKCFPKTLLLNGFQTPNISGDIYLRFPIDYNIPEEKPHVDFSLNCANQSDPSNEVLLDWTYNRKPEHQWVTFMFVQVVNSRGETEHRRLVSWVRDNIKETSGLWLEKIIDPSMNGEYNVRKMEMLVEVALKCVEDDKDARPTMSQVVEMLEDH